MRSRTRSSVRGGAAQAWSPHVDDALLGSGSNEYFQRIGGVTEMKEYGPSSVDHAVTATRGEVAALRHALHAPWRVSGYLGVSAEGGK